MTATARTRVSTGLAMAMAGFVTLSDAAESVLPADPATMPRAALEMEVRAARTVLQKGGVMAKRPAGCTSPESRQFDFWLGEWDVSPAGQNFLIAESSITVHAQGCVIMEHWRPLQGAHGHSINSYDSRDGLWHQEYVDASGQRTPYAGKIVAGVLQMDDLAAAPPGTPPGWRQRMNFQALDADTVRQWGEVSTDGETWKTSWDLIYRRRPGAGA